MEKNNVKKIIVLLLLLVAVVAATLLVGKSQDSRKSAYFDQSRVTLLGNGDVEVSEEGIVQVRATGLQEGTRITAYDIALMVDGPVDAGVVEIESIFNVAMNDEIETIDNNTHRVWVTAYTTEDEEDIPGADVNGVLPLFSFRLLAREEGVVRVYVDPSTDADLAGWNPDPTSVDMDILVANVDEYSFNIGAGALVGDGPRFNFLVKFSGVTEDTTYNGDSVVNVIAVTSAGRRYVYNNVPVTREGSEVGVYAGSVVLATFPEGSDGFALIKGPKHLQTKYCQNGQSTVCETAQGSFSLGPDYEETVYDFSAWPILAGDLPDENMVQDEVVDVSDYTRLVNSLSAGNRTDPDWISRNDINGNNLVETLDLGALLETLSSRYGTLY